MVNDEMRKLVLDKNDILFPLLDYIKDHEMEEKGAYKEIITDYMREKQFCSRLTTLNMISALLQEGVLTEEKIMNYRSKLKINSEYNFYELWAQLLVSEHSKINEKLRPLKHFIAGDALKRLYNDKKISELLEVPQVPTIMNNKTKKVKLEPLVMNEAQVIKKVKTGKHKKKIA